MLTILLAMLEDEEDQRKFLKLHTAYEQKLYRIALKILRVSRTGGGRRSAELGAGHPAF